MPKSTPNKRHLYRPDPENPNAYAVLCGIVGEIDYTEEPKKATCGNCKKIYAIRRQWWSKTKAAVTRARRNM